MMTTHDRAYRAISRAAERVGAAGHAAQRASHLRARRSPRTFRYVPTGEHRELVTALGELARGRIDPEEAMALLHYGETAEHLDRARRAGH